MNPERKTLAQSVTPIQMETVTHRAHLRRTFASGRTVQHVVTGKHFEVLELMEQEELVIVGLPDGRPDFTHTFPVADLKPV